MRRIKYFKPKLLSTGYSRDDQEFIYFFFFFESLINDFCLVTCWLTILFVNKSRHQLAWFRQTFRTSLILYRNKNNATLWICFRGILNNLRLTKDFLFVTVLIMLRQLIAFIQLLTFKQLFTTWINMLHSFKTGKSFFCAL